MQIVEKRPITTAAAGSVAFLLSLYAVASPVAALTAKDVLNKMNDDERFSYLAGIADGLAQARWMKDKPDDTGMKCIYDWYYKGGKRKFNQVYGLLELHPEKPTNAIMYVLIKKECGE